MSRAADDAESRLLLDACDACGHDPEGDRLVRAGIFPGSQSSHLEGTWVWGKTIGLIVGGAVIAPLASLSVQELKEAAQALEQALDVCDLRWPGG